MFYNKFISNILKFIYPKKCVLCQEVIPIVENTNICKECYFEVDFSIPAKNCINFIFPYTNNVKNAIHRFKYYNRPDYAKVFAKLIYNKILYQKIDFDAIYYVPMHFDKKRKRGYDQSYLLAYELSLLCCVPVCDDLVRKINTIPQSKVSFEQRKTNVLGVFTLLNKNNAKDKNILLIDDIFTTGNTIFQCCEQLKLANAKSVTLFTFAKV